MPAFLQWQPVCDVYMVVRDVFCASSPCKGVQISFQDSTRLWEWVLRGWVLLVGDLALVKRDQH